MGDVSICQVGHVGVDVLWCPARESGGYQCERLDPHVDGHFVGSHSIEHAYRGIGYACRVDPVVVTGGLL